MNILIVIFSLVVLIILLVLLTSYWRRNQLSKLARDYGFSFSKGELNGGYNDEVNVLKGTIGNCDLLITDRVFFLNYLGFRSNVKFLSIITIQTTFLEFGGKSYLLSGNWLWSRYYPVVKLRKLIAGLQKNDEILNNFRQVTYWQFLNETKKVRRKLAIMLTFGTLLISIGITLFKKYVK